MAFWDFLARRRPDPVPPAPAAPVPPVVAPAEVAAAEVVVPAEPPPPPSASPPAFGPQPGDFLPVTRDELVKGAAEVRRGTGWMFFGRRDIIPPAADARTLLIDRGMLTQGLVTAEELAAMHRVGDEYAAHADRFQHATVKAGQTAEQAVGADRAARAELKARKKADAARRARERAEAVARRKATDITFAGRGVSARLHDRRSDAAALAALALPVLSTPAELAAALGLAVPRLRWLCYHTDAATRTHYVQFEVPKKSGGVRTLAAPHATLAAAQGWVLANILGRLPTEGPAHGFVPGRSTVTNAAPHAGQDVVVNVDLADFFPSVGFARVRHLFARCGYSGAVSTLLALLCTECPRRRVQYAGRAYFVATGPRGLPQGACTSPAASNQVARKLDRRLSALASKLGFAYTRYADDLTFSAPPGRRERVGYLLARVRHIAADEGFALNPRKTRVQRPETQQRVTGLVVNAAPAVPREVVRRLRAILHRAGTEGLAAQNRQNHPHFRAWVEGMIAYVAMVQPARAEQLRAALAAAAD